MDESTSENTKLFLDPMTPKTVGSVLLGLLLIIPVYIVMLLSITLYGLVWLVGRVLYVILKYEPMCIESMLHCLFRYGCCKPMDFLKNLLCGCCVWNSKFNFDFYEEEEQAHRVFERLTLNLKTEATVFKHEVVSVEKECNNETAERPIYKIPPPPPVCFLPCDCGNVSHLEIDDECDRNPLVHREHGDDDDPPCQSPSTTHSSDGEDHGNRDCDPRVNLKFFEVATSDEDDPPKPYFREKVKKK
ncbi:protein EE32 [Proboscivirus elephantidbeta5]|uniref:Protein EE32 n=1 Tax=Elephant endotheliotropic herpesvirus 5 TaxID=768738 RepID=A0A075CYE0_9BETA|nr:protein EE32 [Elephant endotheliotropic herpesvirus 5]AHC02820.1 protein EE32 [Elephant endotheliotropic herpesvirus 5]